MTKYFVLQVHPVRGSDGEQDNGGSDANKLQARRHRLSKEAANPSKVPILLLESNYFTDRIARLPLFNLFQAGVLDLGTVWQRLRLCLPRQHLLQASRQLQTGD